MDERVLDTIAKMASDSALAQVETASAIRESTAAFRELINELREATVRADAQRRHEHEAIKTMLTEHVERDATREAGRVQNEQRLAEVLESMHADIQAVREAQRSVVVRIADWIVANKSVAAGIAGFLLVAALLAIMALSQANPDTVRALSSTAG